MAKGAHLGEFEQLVLITLVRVGGTAYGAELRREIAATTDREVAIGAVYATLDRLERKGHLRSRVSAPLPVPGGRSRRHYTLTASGRRKLRRMLALLERITDADFQLSLARLEDGAS